MTKSFNFRMLLRSGRVKVFDYLYIFFFKKAVVSKVLLVSFEYVLGIVLIFFDKVDSSQK